MFRGLRVPRARLALQVCRVPRVLRELLVPRVLRVARVRRVLKATSVLPASRVPWVLQVLKALRGFKGRRVFKALSALPGRRVLRGSKARLAQPALPVRQVRKARKGSKELPDRKVLWVRLARQVRKDRRAFRVRKAHKALQEPRERLVFRDRRAHRVLLELRDLKVLQVPLTWLLARCRVRVRLASFTWCRSERGRSLEWQRVRVPFSVEDVERFSVRVRLRGVCLDWLCVREGVAYGSSVRCCCYRRYRNVGYNFSVVVHRPRGVLRDRLRDGCHHQNGDGGYIRRHQYDAVDKHYWE